LNSFIELNNLSLARFTPDERQRIGVHTARGQIVIPRTVMSITRVIAEFV
jgi:hypothetical protein